MPVGAGDKVGGCAGEVPSTLCDNETKRAGVCAMARRSTEIDGPSNTKDNTQYVLQVRRSAAD